MGDTDTKIISIEFAAAEETHVQFFALAVVDVSADTVEMKGTAAGTVVVPVPAETWGSGRHVLPLYYPIENLISNFTNTFNVYLRMTGGSGSIETGGCIASISVFTTILYTMEWTG